MSIGDPSKKPGREGVYKKILSPSIGKAGDPRFESSQLRILFTINCIEKTKRKKKRLGMGLLKILRNVKNICWFQEHYLIFVNCSRRCYKTFLRKS